MSFSLTIDGTEAEVMELEVSLVSGNRGTARFVVLSKTGLYIPALDKEVLVTEDGLRVFGGYVDTKLLRQFGDLGPPAIATEVNCVDYNSLLDRRVLNRSITSAALAITAISVGATPTIATVTPHGYTTGNIVSLGGTNSTPAVDGLHTVTVTSTTTFTIAVATTVAGSAGFSYTGTLKSFVTVLATYLAPYGVTLDVAQADGPLIPGLAWNGTKLRAVADDLTKYSGGWVPKISNYKVFGFYEPGLTAAPFNIDDTLRNTVGDLTVETTRNEYFNQVVVQCDSIGTLYSDRLVAEETEVYYNAPYTAHATAARITKAAHGLTVGTTLYLTGSSGTNINGFCTVAAVISASVFSINKAAATGGTVNVYTEWGQQRFNLSGVWSSDTGTLTVNGVATDMVANGWYAQQFDVSPSGWVLYNYTPQTLGTVIEYSYTGLFPGSIVVPSSGTSPEIVAHGVWEDIISAAPGTTAAAATALGQSYVDAHSVVPRVVKYQTYNKGLLPDQSQTVTRTSRGIISTVFSITEVVTRMIGEGTALLMRDVSLVEGNSLVRNWRETYEIWSGQSSTTSSGSSSVSGGGGGTATRGWYYFLGSSDATYVQSPTSPGWVPAGIIKVIIDTVLRGSSTATVTVDLTAIAGTVKARLYDVSNSTSCGESAVTASGFVVFPVTLTPGRYTYRLDLYPSLGDTDVRGVGYVE